MEWFARDPAYWPNENTNAGRLKYMYGELPRIEHGSILDVGCSIGVVTEEIAERYPSCLVVGVDVYKDRVKEARINRQRALYETQDGFATNFPDNMFNMIFCNNNLLYVMEKLSDARLLEIISGTTRPLKRGGYFAVAGEIDSLGTSRGIAKWYGNVILRKDEQKFSLHSKKLLDKDNAMIQGLKRLETLLT